MSGLRRALRAVALVSICVCSVSAASAREHAAAATVELAGVDTGSLVLTEKRLFTKVVHDTNSPCGDPVTIEVCVKENRACKRLD